MQQNLRLRDAIPTVLSLAASVAFTLVLVLLNSGAETVASAAVLVDTEARLVEARAVGSPRAGRQAVSPVVTDVLDSPVVAEVAGVAVVSDSVEFVDGSGEPVGDELPAIDQLAVASDDSGGAGSEGVASGNADESASELAAADIVVSSTEPAIVTVPTTVAISPSPSAQPRAATTTQAPSVTPTTERRPIQRTATTRAPRPTTSVTSPPTTRAPRPTTTTSRPTTTTTTTRAPAPQFVSGSYSVAQVIDGTIGAGDGSNPNEESPMGRHDASLFLPQTWNWAQGTTRNPQWGNLGSNQFAEFRCAVIPENGHVPPVDFRVNFTEGAYYQFAAGSWSKAFDVALDSPSHGAYLGVAGQVNSDPFASGQGAINWRREADGSYSAPWNPAALMMHFWAGERRSPAPGQSAEFLTSQMRLQQPDGKTVDLSQVRVLFQCGIDYYNTTGGQGTKVPGPGIAKYQWLTPNWQPGLWVTLPGNVAASDASDFRTWLEANLPPDVRR